MSEKNKKANIKLDLKNQKPPDLLELLVHVTTSLEEHPEFATPPYTIAELGAKAGVLRTSISEAKEGSLHSKLVRNELVEDAKVTLRSLADYVRMVAQGNSVILSKSGFSLAKVPVKIRSIGRPKMDAARMTGTHGEVKLRWSGVHGRRTYYVYVVAADAGIDEPKWILVATTSKNLHIVQGLDPYKPYYFCVSAVGPKGEGFKSNAVLGRAA